MPAFLLSSLKPYGVVEASKLAVAIRTTGGACRFVPSCTCFSCRVGDTHKYTNTYTHTLSVLLRVTRPRGSISLFLLPFYFARESSALAGYCETIE